MNNRCVFGPVARAGGEFRPSFPRYSPLGFSIHAAYNDEASPCIRSRSSRARLPARPKARLPIPNRAIEFCTRAPEPSYIGNVNTLR